MINRAMETLHANPWEACDAWLRLLSHAQALRNEWHALQQRGVDRDCDALNQIRVAVADAHDWRAFGEAWRQSWNAYAQSSAALWHDAAVWSMHAQRESANAARAWLSECQAAGLRDCSRLWGDATVFAPWRDWLAQQQHAGTESTLPDGHMTKPSGKQSAAAA
ncbi:hypothetical protein ACS0X5_08080 [Burkholderia gladioli]|uniref:hypothetical protein n=1 Tax=Burkholderia gladioli TaxID=28095 RepID=UPI00030E4F6F|nr:hypothetical protein [Burkholderia gladioli]MBW5286314.1 hypothetical protein [Burkholderia gladioli]NHH79678.1 hypothetical protein [Burkholderia gladioli]CAG9224866.1 conserved hypothetical protein [Burkholderia gladioli]